MGKKKLTTEEFIKRARKVHGGKYDYSKVKYINRDTKVCIVCAKHGEFWQKPESHVNNKAGCPSCYNERRSKKFLSNTSTFIERAKQVHGNRYDYSKVEYVHSKKKVCIICPIHGEFWQTPNDHLDGCGCPLCGVLKVASSRKLTTEEFIERSKKVHGDKYDYSKVEYVNSHTKVCIICPIHGEFWQEPCNHLNGVNCPKCKESRYELEIREILDKKGVSYTFQYRNKDILGLLTLDFFLPNYKIGIECQGIQHFKSIDFSGNGDVWAKKLLEENKRRDNLKIKKCKENGVTLIHYNPFKEYYGTYENEIHSTEELEKILL